MLPNNSDVFIYNSGFNLIDEQKINIMFGQMPRIYPIKYEFDYSNFDENFRNKLNFEKFIKIDNKNYNQNFLDIFNLIVRILNRSLPIFILEDFIRLIKFSGKLNFPKNPRQFVQVMHLKVLSHLNFILLFKNF